MWTRLFILIAKQAFKGEFQDGKFFHRAISGHYAGVLKKQFRIQNVPWTFTKLPDDSKILDIRNRKGIKFNNISKN